MNITFKAKYIAKVTVLIDTWWNVNVGFCCRRLGYGAVLIDTWWNVNTQTRKRIALHHIVLIDTWWNVNLGGRVAILSLIYFNRYMVECEFGWSRGDTVTDLVLIDTWWNVNYIQHSKILNPNKF